MFMGGGDDAFKLKPSCFSVSCHANILTYSLDASKLVWESFLMNCPKCGTEIEPPKWLSKGGRKRWEGVSSSDRSEMAKKGWAKRKAKTN